jgi:hypothetical protein
VRLLRRIPLTPLGWVLVVTATIFGTTAIIIGSGPLAGAAILALLLVLVLMLPPSPSIDRFGGGRLRLGGRRTEREDREPR